MLLVIRSNWSKLLCKLFGHRMRNDGSMCHRCFWIDWSKVNSDDNKEV